MEMSAMTMAIDQGTMLLGSSWKSIFFLLPPETLGMVLK